MWGEIQYSRLQSTQAKAARDSTRAKRAVDRTRYGTTRISTKSYFTHHTQQIAKAAVMYDARAILKRVTVLKQTCLRAGTAAHAAACLER